jgi:hypothetical protein
MVWVKGERSGHEGVGGVPAGGGLLGEGPVQVAARAFHQGRSPDDQAGGQAAPRWHGCCRRGACRCARTCGSSRPGPAAGHEPVAGPDHGVQAVLAAQLGVARHQAVHDLALVEDHRVGAGLAEMAGEGAVGGLEGEFPVDHAVGPRHQFRRPSNLRSGQEGFDDVAGGLRVAGQPAVLEAPAGGHAAGVGFAVAHVLGAAEPVDGGGQVRGLWSRCSWAAGLAQAVRQDQAQMARAPGLIAEGQADEFGDVH